MHHRHQHFMELGLAVRWLEAGAAAHANAYAETFCSNQHYGLNEATVADIKRLKITSASVAREWLTARFPASGTVQIVFGKAEVCVMDCTQFLAHWQNLFVPSRDDVVVVHNLGPSIVYYSHEDELEVGRRNGA